MITVAKRAAVNGHAGAGHQDGRDIIPSFNYIDPKGTALIFPGQNIDAAGLLRLGSGCKAAVLPPVVLPPVVTPPVVTPPVPPPQGVGVLPTIVTRPGTAPRAEVLPFVVTAPVPAATRTSVTPAAARVAQTRPVAQARPAALPFTGSDTDTLLTTAIGLLMLGCASVAAGRRRKTVSIG